MMWGSRVLNYLSGSLLWAVICVSGYGAETNSIANSVNDVGGIAGARYVNSYPYVLRATMWFRDIFVFDLGTLPGGTSSEALSINNLGQVVGYSTTRDGSTHAFLWQMGWMHDLGTLGPDYVYSRANGINDKGDVVGVSCKQDHPFIQVHDPYPPSGDPSCRAFLWSRGHMRDLGLYPGGTFSAAQAINNKGQVVGSGDVGPDPVYPDDYPDPPYRTRALLWNNGTPTAITGVSTCLCGTFGTGINDRGVVIGFEDVPYVNTYGFSWAAGNRTDFGAYFTTGESIAIPTGINNRGQIVGWRYGTDIPEIDKPFLFQNGQLTSLPTLTPQNWEVSSAEAINEFGLIVGSDSGKAAMWDHGVLKALK